MIDAPDQVRTPADAIRIFVARLSERYEIRGTAAYEGFENGAIRRDTGLNLVVVLRHEMQDPASVATDMGWDALALYLESGFRIVPIPVFHGHWQEPASAPDPESILRLKMKSVWLWL